MTILFIYDGMKNTKHVYAGTNTMIWCMAVACFKSGMEVCVSGGGIDEYEEKDGIRLFPKRSGTQNMVDQADVVVLCTTFLTKDIRKRKGQKWVLWHHCWGMRPEEVEFFEKKDIVICVSEPQAQNLIGYGAPQHKIRVVPNCLQEDIPEYVVNEDRDGVMYAGTIAQHKGVDKFIVGALLSCHHEISIFGDAELCGDKERYRNSMHTLADKVYVKWHGIVPRKELYDAYKKHSLIVLPSDCESFCLVAAEAQAMGCIPVVPRNSAFKWVAQHAEFYDENTPQQIADAIDSAQKSMNNGWRYRAAMDVRDRFSHKKSCELFVKTITDLL
jgi:glycosyltransferase involved in cell wall biosynthesis